MKRAAKYRPRITVTMKQFIYLRGGYQSLVKAGERISHREKMAKVLAVRLLGEPYFETVDGTKAIAQPIEIDLELIQA